MPDDELKKIELEEDVIPEEAESEDETTSSEIEKDSKKAETSMKKNTQVSKTGMSLVLAIVIVIVGTASGYGLNMISAGGSATSSTEEVATDGKVVDADSVVAGEKYGQEKEDSFDGGIGVLMKGGFEGEGSHRILREGGPTQTIYVTSSIIDLDPFIGHEVEVWGETFAAQKVPWLMDVYGVEVRELDAETPFEEEPTASADEDEELEDEDAEDADSTKDPRRQ